MNIYLDTETTGLHQSAEVIQLGIIDDCGKVLLDTLVQCLGDVTKQASFIHGITADHLSEAPCWPDVFTKLLHILQQADRVYIYNASFDEKLLYQTSQRYNLIMPNIQSVCIMNWYANKFNRGYRRKLVDACDDLFVDTRGILPHTAVGDCELTRRLHRAMLFEIKDEERARQARQKSKISRDKRKAKKLTHIPANFQQYPNFGQVNRPDGYRTLSSIPLKELHRYTFAGTCCNTFGGTGYLFKPIR